MAALSCLFAVQCDPGPSENGGGSAEAASEAGRKRRSETEGASRAGLGERIDDIAFEDLDGVTSSFRALSDGHPLVVVMRDEGCPVTRKYGRTVADLEIDLGRRGVRFLFLNPSPHDTPAHAREDRSRFGFRGAYVHDPSGRIGAALRATSTAEVFLFDGDLVLRYRGAVDDRFGIGFESESASRRYLEEAAEAVLAGQQPAVQATTAPGCFLDFERPTAVAGGPTFHRDVLPILQKNCQTCHRPGEPAPFHLVRYEDVAGRRGMVRWVLENDAMPPWYADDHVGGPWANDLRMPAAAKETVLRWIDQGCVEGDPKDAPPPLPVAEGWKIGVPDLVIQVPEAIEVPPEGFYEYEYRVVDTGLEEDRFVRKLELTSDNLDAVHHIVIFEYRDEMSEWTGLQRGYLALQGFYGIWFPGTEPIIYTSDRGKLLKKGTRFLFQIHYNGNGRTVRDRPRAGFVFTDEKPETLLRCDAAYTVDISLPPGSKGTVLKGDYVFDRRARVYGFLPHMHTRGVACRIELIPPEGEPILALQVSEYDFEWQQTYRLETPIDVPAGTILRMTGRYDNSEDNPANPDPERWVTFGLSTNDEMLVGYFEWTPLD